MTPADQDRHGDACLDDDALGELAEGRISGDRLATVDRHLDGCGDCRRLVAGMARLWGGEATHQANSQGQATGESLLSCGTAIGRYRVLHQIGEGAIGVIYAAYDPELRRRVAVKLLRERGEQQQARLLREAQAMAKLSHPNVISVFDVGTYEGSVFLAMELIDGITLRDWLSTRRHWRAVVEMFVRAGRGLAAAHSEGVVHRDFKPANVLIGSDGRVRVSDFGLARFDTSSATRSPASPRDPAAPFAAAPADPTLTDTGWTAGTPAYMAPEQRRGAQAEPASDQYSFCVALYEGLHGHRPGGGMPDPPARGSPIPRWVGRTILRGLESEPYRRFPSMNALLSALTQEPIWSRPRTWVLAASALLLVAGGSAAGAHRRSTCEAEAGPAPSELFEKHEETLRAAFAATGARSATRAWAAVETALGSYHQAWVEARRQVCGIRVEWGAEAETLRQLQRGCLRERADEVDVLVDALREIKPTELERATSYLRDLRPPQRCTQLAALLGDLPPVSADLRRSVQAVRKKLAEARATSALGRHGAGLAMARRLAEETRAIPYRPLRAEALLLLGTAHERAGDYPQAEQAFAQAEREAESSRHDRAVVEARIGLAWVLGVRQHRPDAARSWAERGASALERFGGDPLLEVRLASATGGTYYREERYDLALAHYQRALELAQATLGSDHLEVARQLSNLGLVLDATGRTHEALAHHRQALGIRERLFGTWHPEAAASWSNLAGALLGLEQYEESAAHYQRALGIYQDLGQGEDLNFARVVDNLGLVRQKQGKRNEAVELHQRALEIHERALGPQHPLVASSLFRVAMARGDRGEHGQALQLLERGLRIQVETLGPRHPKVAGTRDAIGWQLQELGRAREAVSQHREAITLLELSSPPPPEQLALCYTNLGHAYLKLSSYPRAVAALERALDLRTPINGDRLQLGEIRFALARALERSRGAFRRARQLAELARQDYAASPQLRASENVAEIDAWLSRRAEGQ